MEERTPRSISSRYTGSTEHENSESDVEQSEKEKRTDEKEEHSTEGPYVKERSTENLSTVDTKKKSSSRRESVISSRSDSKQTPDGSLNDKSNNTESKASVRSIGSSHQSLQSKSSYATQSAKSEGTQQSNSRSDKNNNEQAPNSRTDIQTPDKTDDTENDQASRASSAGSSSKRRSVARRDSTHSTSTGSKSTLRRESLTTVSSRSETPVQRTPLDTKGTQTPSHTAGTTSARTHERTNDMNSSTTPQTDKKFPWEEEKYSDYYNKPDIQASSSRKQSEATTESYEESYESETSYSRPDTQTWYKPRDVIRQPTFEEQVYRFARPDYYMYMKTTPVNWKPYKRRKPAKVLHLKKQSRYIPPVVQTRKKPATTLSRSSLYDPSYSTRFAPRHLRSAVSDSQLADSAKRLSQPREVTLPPIDRYGGVFTSEQQMSLSEVKSMLNRVSKVTQPVADARRITPSHIQDTCGITNSFAWNGRW